MMKVQTYKELEDLIPKVESDLEVAVKEREKLGLTIPEDYQVCITFYNSENAKATAQGTSSGSIICVNALRTAMEQLDEQDRNKLSGLTYYFDITRTFLRDESWIRASIEDPVKTLGDFEKAFKSEQIFQIYKEGCKARGREYDSYKDFTIKNAEKAKKTLEELMPSIKEGFKKADLSLRHELDHSAFFTSQIYKDFNSKLALTKQLQHKLGIEKDQSVSKELAKANMEVLKAKVEIEPLLEPRALFFTHVKPDEWDKADFEKVKNKVYGNFLLSYIERAFPQDILDPLVSQKWSNGEMDTATSMFLFYTVNLQRQSANSIAYVIQPEKVNYNIANKVLYQELPEWKAKLAKNARTAVEAIGNAYKEKPSRLKEANNSKTFEEFIEICKGGK